MALKKANQEISSIDRKKMDCIIRDLAMEITVGGDRFDRQDLCFAILKAGGDSSCLKDIQDKVIETAKTMQPGGQQQVEFFTKSLNFWLDESFFADCKAMLEYTPSPVPYENQFLSKREADFTTLLERELHSDFCERKLCEGWVATGDYKAMLYRALPALNDELRIGQSILKNTDKGYVYDGKPLNEFTLPDRVTIATNALGAAGIQDKVIASDDLKDWNDLSNVSRTEFYKEAWALFKSFKALGYTIDESGSLLNFKITPDVDREVLIDKLSRQIHDVKESTVHENITADHVPFDSLSETSRCEFRNEVESMLKLMDRKKLRPVMQADISKKVKVTNDVSL